MTTPAVIQIHKAYFMNHIAYHFDETDPKTDAVQQLAEEIQQFVQEQGWQETIDRMAIERYQELTSHTTVQKPPLQPRPEPKHGEPSQGFQNDTTPASIYTDGSCEPNPGPGGWCAILNAPGKPELVLKGSETDTTNNRMEMRAIIKGLKAAGPNRDVTVYTDSRYVIDAFNKNWLKNWERNGWKTRRGEPVLNQDLWNKLQDLVRGNGQRRCEFRKVKAHAGDPMNERADEIAVQERIAAQTAT